MHGGAEEAVKTERGDKQELIFYNFGLSRGIYG